MVDRHDPAGMRADATSIALRPTRARSVEVDPPLCLSPHISPVKPGNDVEQMSAERALANFAPESKLATDKCRRVIFNRQLSIAVDGGLSSDSFRARSVPTTEESGQVRN